MDDKIKLWGNLTFHMHRFNTVRISPVCKVQIAAAILSHIDSFRVLFPPSSPLFPHHLKFASVLFFDLHSSQLKTGTSSHRCGIKRTLHKLLLAIRVPRIFIRNQSQRFIGERTIGCRSMRRREPVEPRVIDWTRPNGTNPNRKNRRKNTKGEKNQKKKKKKRKKKKK